MALPALLYAIVIAWEVASGPPVEKPFEKALYGFLLVASVAGVPWLLLCSLGFALGLWLRRRVLPEAPEPAPKPAPARPVAAPPRAVAAPRPRPAPAATPDTGTTADGTLRFEHRLGEEISPGRFDSLTAAATLIDEATGQVIFDGAAWEYSRITPQPDGSLFLRLRQNHHERLYRIDPATRRFVDLGERGDPQPLTALAAEAEAARRAGGPPLFRFIAPDASLRVDLLPVEWANSQWVNTPKVTALADGRVLLDLSDTDWDATVEFPRAQCVQLALRRYRRDGFLVIELDLAAEYYTMLAETGAMGQSAPAPLADVADGLALAWQRAEAAAKDYASDHWPHRSPPQPGPLAAWRSAVVILVGAIAAIVLFTQYTLQHTTPPPQVLTPLPGPPPRR